MFDETVRPSRERTESNPTAQPRQLRSATLSVKPLGATAVSIPTSTRGPQNQSPRRGTLLPTVGAACGKSVCIPSPEVLQANLDSPSVLVWTPNHTHVVPNLGGPTDAVTYLMCKRQTADYHQAHYPKHAACFRNQHDFCTLTRGSRGTSKQGVTDHETTAHTKKAVQDTKLNDRPMSCSSHWRAARPSFGQGDHTVCRSILE